MRVIGLTGSIGMGKSTTAAMFAARGVPVHDSDRAVHGLYAGTAVAPMEAAFPGVVVAGKVDRRLLSERVLGNPDALARLEAIVHPLVRASEAEFLEKGRAAGRPLVVLDVPLLFESGEAQRTDLVVLATASPEIQRARVLARPGMSPQKFESLLARQLSDGEKRRRAHFLVDTGHGFAAAERQVGAILRALALGV